MEGRSPIPGTAPICHSRCAVLAGCLLIPPPERRIHPAAPVPLARLPDKSGVPIGVATRLGGGAEIRPSWPNSYRGDSPRLIYPGTLSRRRTVVEHHLAPDGTEGYSAEVFNALGDTLAVITVPDSALEPLREDEALCARVLAAA